MYVGFSSLCLLRTVFAHNTSHTKHMSFSFSQQSVLFDVTTWSWCWLRSIKVQYGQTALTSDASFQLYFWRTSFKLDVPVTPSSGLWGRLTELLRNGQMEERDRTRYQGRDGVAPSFHVFSGQATFSASWCILQPGGSLNPVGLGVFVVVSGFFVCLF